MALSRPNPPSMNTQVSYIPQRISHLGKAQIAKLLNPASPSDWRMLASLLAFSDTDIQNYEHRDGVVRNYNVTVEILRKWEQRFQGAINMDELKAALTDIGRQDVLGVIQDLIDDDKFFDVQKPSSRNGSPRSSIKQSPFPSAPVVEGFQNTVDEDEIFKSDLQPDLRRVPMEDSYSSLNSLDQPPDANENQVACFKTPTKPSAYSAAFNNTSPSANGGPPPLPANFKENLKIKKQPKPSEMTHRGTPTEQSKASQLPLGARPKTRHRSENGHRPENGSQHDSTDEPGNIRRSTSCENNHSSSSSSSESMSSSSNSWPHKENPLKSDPNFINRNPHKPIDEDELRAPGDYRTPGEKMFHSWPGEDRYNHRTDISWTEGSNEPTHRQVNGRREHCLSQVSYGISSAPHQCKTGIAYGITFAWKDWKCGMDLARKLKMKGHHVELDRKTSWYRDTTERDLKLSKVLGSCKYIIVIVTANYENEINGKASSEINARFIFDYMKAEYTKNKNKNKRFIPIVDTRTVKKTHSMFDKYPAAEHSYIIRLIRQQGVIVERQYSMN